MLPKHNSSSDWMKLLASRDGKPLIQLALVVFAGGAVALMTLTVVLYSGTVRLIDWAREQPSPYAVISDSHFSFCAREAHDLWEKASAYQRLQDSPGLAGENAYQQWRSQSGRFARHCGAQNWPGQDVPQHPADWLTFSGANPADWPEDIPALEE